MSIRDLTIDELALIGGGAILGPSFHPPVMPPHGPAHPLPPDPPTHPF